MFEPNWLDLLLSTYLKCQIAKRCGLFLDLTQPNRESLVIKTSGFISKLKLACLETHTDAKLIYLFHNIKTLSPRNAAEVFTNKIIGGPNSELHTVFAE